MAACAPLLAAGFDWLEALLPLLFVFIWIVSQVLNVFRRVAAAGRRDEDDDEDEDDADEDLFGNEGHGAPDWLHAECEGQRLTIPHKNNELRSLNLSTSVGIAAYEALRQLR